jgi:hypothetical protein
MRKKLQYTQSFKADPFYKVLLWTQRVLRRYMHYTLQFKRSATVKFPQLLSVVSTSYSRLSIILLLVKLALFPRRRSVMHLMHPQMAIPRGEAINVLYLKRVSDAIRDGDPIRGVIRGSSLTA